MRALFPCGLIAAIVTSALLPATSLGQSGYQATRIDAPPGAAELNGRWAERTVPAGDVDDDGTPDFWLAQPFLDVGDTADQGRVYLLSGDDGAIIDTIDSPEPQANAAFGFYISVPGDLDGDGVGDIVIGTDSQDVGDNVDQGKAWAFSGEDGGLLYDLANPAPQADGRFGSRVGGAGDVTDDGVGDVLIGASNNDSPAGCAVGIDTETEAVPPGCHNDQGQAFIFDGTDGELVRMLDIPPGDQDAIEDANGSCTSGCGSFGLAVQSPGDTNGDGVADQLVNAGSYRSGRMYLFSGADGSLLLRIDPPGDPEESGIFGFQDAALNSPGDVNGDGNADIYGETFLDPTPDPNPDDDEVPRDGPGRAWVFDGETGRVLYRLEDPTPDAGGQFGWSLARTDFNGDRTPDLYVGQAPHHEPGSRQVGGSYIFDGRDGSLLRRFEVPKSDRQPGSDENGGNRLGWTVAAPGDLNGDGREDYLAGAPFQDARFKDEGVLYVFVSQQGAGRPGCAGRQPTIAGDPDGDGIIRGTRGRDVIIGTADRDVIRGKGGNDVVCGRGGGDRIFGGAGRDELRGNAGDDDIAGNKGRDELRGQAGNDTLRGGPGGDHLVGGGGSDEIRGGKGRDR